MKDSRTSNKLIVPVFNKEHIEYLNRVFPESTLVQDTNTMYHTAGQRSLLKHIEHLIETARKHSGVQE